MDNPPPAATPPLPPMLGASPQPGTPPADGWAVDAGRGVALVERRLALLHARRRSIWIVIAILFVAIMIGLSLIPILGQFASMLLHPVLAAGVMIGCRAQDRGGELTIGHLFAGFGDTALAARRSSALLYLAGWIRDLARSRGAAGRGDRRRHARRAPVGDPMQAGLAMLAALEPRRARRAAGRTAARASRC